MIVSVQQCHLQSCSASPTYCGNLTPVLTVCPVADAVPRAQEQIKETMLIAADIESFVKQTLGV